MKLIAMMLLTTSLFAQVIVDPVGDDDWKLVKFKTELIDNTTLPDPKLYEGFSCETKAKFSFGGAKTFLLNKNYNKTLKKTIPGASNGDYLLEIFVGDQRFKIHKGRLENGSKDLIAKLRRIDINDMLVTREDGSTYNAKGKVEVFVSKSGNWKRMCYFNTGHGITVVPGHQYKVRVEARTEDGLDRYVREISL